MTTTTTTTTTLPSSALVPGSRTLYEGEIAAAILKTSKSLGGTMTAEDLSGFSAEWVEPISIDYRGWRVYELPPNGQGMAALEMLNILETLPLPDYHLSGVEALPSRRS
jgi:gamma-glutamyltranspeptidase/glutathione hydrolase